MQKRGNSYRTVSIFIERDIVVFLSVCPSVCPFVCPSNAGTVSKWMDISCTRFWRSGTGVILVSSFFEPRRRYKIPIGTPLVLALNSQGWEKFAIVTVYLGNGTR